MREFLDDAHAHREDGYGRAQAHVKPQLPKRSDAAAEVQPHPGEVEAYLGKADDATSLRRARV